MPTRYQYNSHQGVIKIKARCTNLAIMIMEESQHNMGNYHGTSWIYAINLKTPNQSTTKTPIESTH
jgi:hypothetical protein